MVSIRLSNAPQSLVLFDQKRLLRYRPMKKLKKLLLLAVILFFGATLWYLDFTDPSIVWETPESIGENSQLTLSFQDQGKGLRHVKLNILNGKQAPANILSELTNSSAIKNTRVQRLAHSPGKIHCLRYNAQY